MFDAFIDILTIGLHALVAWVLVEVFVNNAYRLNRRAYIFWHYVSVVTSFAAVFAFYFHQFNAFPVFIATFIAMSFVFVLEVIVFHFLYSGERWFLNFVDWLLPIFLAMSTIYFVGWLIQ